MNLNVEIPSIESIVVYYVFFLVSTLPVFNLGNLFEENFPGHFYDKNVDCIKTIKNL